MISVSRISFLTLGKSSSSCLICSASTVVVVVENRGRRGVFLCSLSVTRNPLRMVWGKIERSTTEERGTGGMREEEEEEEEEEEVDCSRGGG